MGKNKVIIIDNSVLMKAFLDEEGSGKVREILRLAYTKQITLMAPTLIVFEFLNALCKAVGDYEEVKKAYAQFKKLQIGLMDPDENYIFGFLEDVCGKGISYYDASYHALAKSFDAVFLTADKAYYKIMKNKGNVELFK